MEDRFWSRIEKTPDCWLWTGSIQKSNGYGVINESGMKGRRWYAHRYSYTLHHGDIPAGMIVCHRCDNPPCVNPAHLFLGDWKTNMVDAASKARMTHGEDCHSAHLTEEKVKELRARWLSGGCTYKGLAREYGVYDQAIKYAITGRTWKHVPFPADWPANFRYVEKSD